MTRTRNGRRSAFTLIEIMGVIVIIGILIALLLPAVNAALKYANQTKAITEIHQLESALQNFQSKFDIDYVPSQLKLCALFSNYGTTQLDIDSKQFLLKMFPKMYNPAAATTPWQGIALSGGVAYVRWTYDSSWTSSSTVILEGHQCLVFLLGGIQTSTTISGVTTYGCTGFSTNMFDPSDNYTANLQRIPQSFEFEPRRLVQWASTGSSGSGYSSKFLSYLDPISFNTTSSSFASGAQPYAYFSHYKIPNGYNRTSAVFTGYGTTYDNPTLGFTNGAYYINGTSSPTQFLKPNSFQVICSGFDGVFGTGGAWATNGSLSTGNAADDLTNFAPGQLKGGQ